VLVDDLGYGRDQLGRDLGRNIRRVVDGLYGRSGVRV
jgi:hypothetical protein